MLGHNKTKSAPNITTAATTTATAATSTAKQTPRSSHNFQLKMLDETLSIGVNQVTAQHIYISTYLYIYTSTYLHIYISRYLDIYVAGGHEAVRDELPEMRVQCGRDDQDD